MVTIRYDTTYGLEQMPHEDLYRDFNSLSGLRRERPSLLRLHEARGHDMDMEYRGEKPEEEEETLRGKTGKNALKLGWCSGVMLRGVLSIIGTMLFLRHGFIIGQSGLFLGSAIVIAASLVCLITTFSLSAIATNGTIRGGGAYFLLSRSLGAEWGCAIGVVLSVSNCLSCALCVVGFAESIQSITREHNLPYMVSAVNDIRIISVITLCMLVVVVVASIRFETVIMYCLCCVLTISMTNFVAGSFMATNKFRLENGVVGYSLYAIAQNMRPKLTNELTAGKIFGIFFPSMTGVLAGVNISGNLKNPTRAIPRGTILALLICSVIYVLAGLIFGSTTLPNGVDLAAAIMLPANCSLDECNFKIGLPTVFYKCTGLAGCLRYGNFNIEDFPCKGDSACGGGLLNNYNIMKCISAYPPLLYAGVFSATLSSASASFVAGPKVFQALCRDKILPRFFDYFAVGNTNTDEPQRVYILAFVLSCLLVSIGNLNYLAELVAEFTMIAYVFINYAAYDMACSKSIGWRPSFKWYNEYMSLIGAVASLVCMFVVNWSSALITFVVVMLVFCYVKHRNPNVNWGSSTHAQLYTKGLTNIRKYTVVGDHVKNFRPQCLVLSGQPSHRPDMVFLFWQILKEHQLGLCGNVIWSTTKYLATSYQEQERATEWLHSNNVKMFYTQVSSNSLRYGVRSMMQCSGIGQCKPNVLVIGFKNNWSDMNVIKETYDYFEIIHDAFDLCMGLVIVRPNDDRWPLQKSANVEKGVHFDVRDHSDSCNHEKPPDGDSNPDMTAETQTRKNCHQEGDADLLAAREPMIPSPLRSGNLFNSSTKQKYSGVFNRKKKKPGFVDIWWLFDDGGLTVLLPYMLSKAKEWEGSKIRVFAICDTTKLLMNSRSFATLLAKFRISYDAIHTIDKFDNEAELKGYEEFKTMMLPFMTTDNANTIKHEWVVTEEEMDRCKAKTIRQIRLRNAVKEHSSSADIVFITMAVPRKGTISALLYLGWLDFISRDMPPVLFVRGNQESVLTYYT